MKRLSIIHISSLISLAHEIETLYAEFPRPEEQVSEKIGQLFDALHSSNEAVVGIDVQGQAFGSSQSKPVKEAAAMWEQTIEPGKVYYVNNQKGILEEASKVKFEEFCRDELLFEETLNISNPDVTASKKVALSPLPQTVKFKGQEFNLSGRILNLSSGKSFVILTREHGEILKAIKTHEDNGNIESVDAINENGQLQNVDASDIRAIFSSEKRASKKALDESDRLVLLRDEIFTSIMKLKLRAKDLSTDLSEQEARENAKEIETTLSKTLEDLDKIQL